MVFGSANEEHPGVDHLLNRTNPFYVGGTLEGLQPPIHYDYRLLRRTPAELRRSSPARGGARSWPSRPATRCTVPTSS